MKEIVKEHPLKPIILRFDLRKKQPEFETKGLEAYYAMHDSTWRMRTELIDRGNALDELMDEIAELDFSLLPIEQELEFVEAAAGLRDQADLPLMEGSFTINMDELRAAVNAHGEAMHVLYPKLRAEWEWFDQYITFIYEHEGWIEDDADHLIHQLYARYDEVSVDIVSLDRDQQEFHEAYQVVQDLQDDYFRQGDLFFAQYDKLLMRSNDVYRRFEAADIRITERYGGNDG